mmetsp:Transcript_15551/g.59112  ORF Transcript_15551/g.59112 Transcript_15551/m.59112 type:complete len:236 (-) Transcript_15551:664-1371(-)
MIMLLTSRLGSFCCSSSSRCLAAGVAGSIENRSSSTHCSTASGAMPRSRRLRKIRRVRSSLLAASSDMAARMAMVALYRLGRSPLASKPAYHGSLPSPSESDAAKRDNAFSGRRLAAKAAAAIFIIFRVVVPPSKACRTRSTDATTSRPAAAFSDSSKSIASSRFRFTLSESSCSRKSSKAMSMPSSPLLTSAAKRADKTVGPRVASSLDNRSYSARVSPHEISGMLAIARNAAS